MIDKHHLINCMVLDYRVQVFNNKDIANKICYYFVCLLCLFYLPNQRHLAIPPSFISVLAICSTSKKMEFSRVVGSIVLIHSYKLFCY